MALLLASWLLRKFENFFILYQLTASQLRQLIYIYIYNYIYIYIYIPVVPARGGAEVALGLYYIFFSYRTCMRRAPARPVRACFVGTCCAVVVQEHLRRPRCNATPSEHFLHTSHCALHTPHFALHTSHFISSHLISSHLISPHLSSSHLISSHLFSNVI